MVGGATARFVGMGFIALGVVCFAVLFYLHIVARPTRRSGDWLKGCVVVLAFLGVAGLWLYSHLFPTSFGVCHEVPLNVGTEASIRECQAYSPQDFFVPLGLVGLAVLLLGSAEFELALPGFGLKRKRVVRDADQAAEVLKEGAPTLDERLDKFREALPPSGASETKPPPNSTDTPTQ